MLTGMAANKTYSFFGKNALLFFDVIITNHFQQRYASGIKKSNKVCLL